MRDRPGAWLALTLALAVLGACSSSPTQADVGTASTAVGGFPGCSGLFNTKPSPTGAYYATDFGCSSDPYFNDPGDTCGSAACIQSGFTEGVCSAGMSDAECQRTVNWYSIGGASYGCGARLSVTNPENGKSVVVMVLDNGPSCSVENEAGFWVLDVSYPTIMYLFGEEEGYSDHARIQVEVVGSTTPLGPTTQTTQPTTPGASASSSSQETVATSSSVVPSSSSASSSAPPSSSATPTTASETTVTTTSSSSASPSGPPCADDGDCNPGSDGAGQRCEAGTCVAGCDADWECPGVTSCVDGTCQ